jgi:hypothetical protein
MDCTMLAAVPLLPMGYVVSASRIADRRMILAGYLLADLLTRLSWKLGGKLIGVALTPQRPRRGLRMASPGSPIQGYVKYSPLLEEELPLGPVRVVQERTSALLPFCRNIALIDATVASLRIES